MENNEYNASQIARLSPGNDPVGIQIRDFQGNTTNWLDITEHFTNVTALLTGKLTDTIYLRVKETPQGWLVLTDERMAEAWEALTGSKIVAYSHVSALRILSPGIRVIIERE
jgi:hypothetical protein